MIPSQSYRGVPLSQERLGGAKTAVAVFEGVLIPALAAAVALGADDGGLIGHGAP